MEQQADNVYTLVTGASAGIGKELALEFAKRKNKLFLVALPDSGLEEISESIRDEFGVEVEFLGIDLTLPEAPQQVFDFAKSRGLNINILVNNAGIGFDGKYDELSMRQVDTMILLHVRVSSLLIYLFLPEMYKMEKAYILNISSFAGMAPIPYKSIYSATKGYLFYLSKALSYELKSSNIKVITVYPSGVRTRRSLENIKKSSVMARITSMSPNEVAQTTVAGLYAGKKVLIPGIVTKFYYVLGYILPQGLLLRITSKIFQETN